MRLVLRQVLGLPIVLLAAGCAGGLPEVPADLTAELGDVLVESPLQVTAPGWAITGTVRLVDIPRRSTMQIQVEADGLTPGPHAWHIHTGSCDNIGGIVVPFTPIGAREGIDEPLTASTEGEAAEDALIPASLLSQQQLAAGPYSLNIHNAAGANPGPSVACANLAR